MYDDDGNDSRVGLTVAEIVTNHSAMVLLMLACSSDIKTKVFLQYCKEVVESRQRSSKR